MGQVCSGSEREVEVARDPDDKELDAIEMEEIKISDFDDFFERAAAPLNEMIEIHNGLFLGEQALKEAGSAMLGETQVRIGLATTSRVKMCLWRFDKDDNEEVYTYKMIEEKLDSSFALREAYEHLQAAIAQLNDASGHSIGNAAPSKFIESRGRLKLVSKRGRGAQDSLVREVNLALFGLRKHLALVTQKDALSSGMKIFMKEMSKIQDVSALRVETDRQGSIKLMAGDRELQLNAMAEKMSMPARNFATALQDLIDNVTMAAESIPQLAEQTDAFATEAQQFPSKVPEAAMSSGLGVTEIPKALKNAGKNVKELSRGPRIASQTKEMIVYAARELKETIKSAPVSGNSCMFCEIITYVYLYVRCGNV